MVHPAQIVSVRLRVIGRSRAEIINIVNMVATVLGKGTLNLAILNQTVNGTTCFT